MIRSLLNPAELLIGNPGKFPLIGFIFSTLAFILFYLQTAIDSGHSLIFGIIKGIFFGTFGIAIAGLFIWLILKTAGNSAGILTVLGLIALSYTTTLIFAVVGFLLYLILGWNTAVSCGITGVLFALSPMSGVIISLSSGRKTLSIFIITLTGAYVIFFWALLNKLI